MSPENQVQFVVEPHEPSPNQSNSRHVLSVYTFKESKDKAKLILSGMDEAYSVKDGPADGEIVVGFLSDESMDAIVAEVSFRLDPI